MDTSVSFPHGFFFNTTKKIDEIKELYEFRHSWMMQGNYFGTPGPCTISELVHDLEKIITILDENSVDWVSEPIGVLINDDTHALLSLQKSYISLITADENGAPCQQIYKFGPNTKIE